MIDVMKQALEALELVYEQTDFSNGVTDPTGTMDEGEVVIGGIVGAAIAALRQAIEQSKKQKPVGWFDWDATQEIWVQVYPNTHGQPLYAAPPKRENELDAIDRAYFAGKEAGIDVGEAETKHFEDLADYRLQLLMTMPEQKEWQGLTDDEIKKVFAVDWNQNCPEWVIDFSKRVEAKLREKNT